MPLYSPVGKIKLKCTYLHFKLDEISAFEPKYENAYWNKICEYSKTLTLAKF